MHPEKEYQQVVLITGGASGIGKSTAKIFAKNNHKVVIADRSIELGDEVVKEIKDAGGEAAFVQLEISSEESVKGCIDFAIKTFGRLDSGVNCAGIGGPFGPASETPTEGWKRVFEINTDGAFYFTKHLVNHFKSQPSRVVLDADEELGLEAVKQKGAIVLIESANALAASPNMMAYTATKHAVSGIVKGFALELANEGIRVSTGCILTPIMSAPGFSVSKVKDQFLKQQAMKRFAHPDEVASCIYFLNSDEASFVTGTEMSIDAGWTAH